MTAGFFHCLHCGCKIRLPVDHKGPIKGKCPKCETDIEVSANPEAAALAIAVTTGRTRPPSSVAVPQPPIIKLKGSPANRRKKRQGWLSLLLQLILLGLLASGVFFTARVRWPAIVAYLSRLSIPAIQTPQEDNSRGSPIPPYRDPNRESAPDDHMASPKKPPNPEPDKDVPQENSTAPEENPSPPARPLTDKEQPTITLDLRFDSQVVPLPKSVDVEQDEMIQFRLLGISFPPAFEVTKETNSRLESRPVGRIGDPIVVTTESVNGIVVRFQIALVRLESDGLVVQIRVEGASRKRPLRLLSHEALGESISKAIVNRDAAPAEYNEARGSLQLIDAEIARLSSLNPDNPFDRHAVDNALKRLSRSRKNVISTGNRAQNTFKKNVNLLDELQRTYSILTAFDQHTGIDIEIFREVEGVTESLVVFGVLAQLPKAEPQSTVR